LTKLKRRSWQSTEDVPRRSASVAAFAYGTSMVRLLRFFTESVGVGGLPPALRAQFEPEGIIAVAEKLGVRQRFSGPVPGRFAALSIQRHKGLVVITHQRLYTLVPTLARLKQPAIDQPWDSPGDGPAKATLDGTGVVLTVDLKRVDPRFSGELSTTWKIEFGEDVLAALPARSLRFSVSPEYVFSSLGVSAR
jgi:hypothetical protein